MNRRLNHAIAIGALLFGAIAARSVFAADEPTADDLLRARGLERVGHVWCLPAEADLRERMGGLEHVEQRLLSAQQAVDQIVGPNEVARQRIAQLTQIAQQSQALATSAKQGTAEKIQFEVQAKQAAAALEGGKRQYVVPAQLGLSPPLKTALSDLANVRTDSMLRLLPVREEIDDLNGRYDSLRHDKSVAAEIRSTGQQESLGPLKNFRDEERFIDKLQPLVFSESLPIVREGPFYRVTAIVNERQPLTFSYMGTGGQPTLIPQNLAEAAGLAIDEHAAKIKVPVGGGREEMAWPTKVRQLRFGRHVVRDVEAYILPPEAADLGARISAAALPGYHVQLDTDRLTLTVGGGK